MTTKGRSWGGLGGWRQKMTPKWLAARQSKKTLAEDQKLNGAYSMKNLLKPLKEECRFWEEMKFQKLFGLSQRKTEVLFIYGNESFSHLQVSLQSFSNVLAHMKVMDFDGMGHSGLSNNSEGGDPGRVAIELRNFSLDAHNNWVGYQIRIK